jgi:hypothetical protein
VLVCSAPLKLLLTVLDPRGGLAFGHAVKRAGDWYGSPVNLASRVTSVLTAGMMRVTEPTRKAIGDPAGIEWLASEARHLKGIRGEVLLYGARRVPAGRSREAIGSAWSEAGQPAQVHSGVHFGVALVDVVEGVLAGDELVELQLSGAIQVEHPGNVVAGIQ